jgi:hypothetical protein
MIAAQGGHALEGATKVDAMLIAPETGFAVLFEAKVLADACSWLPARPAGIA